MLQLAPPSVVVTMLAPPTAVHAVPLRQLMALRAVDPVGAPRSFHWEPPSVVLMTLVPTAKHTRSLTHEIPLRAVALLGGVCGIQVVPPSVVLRMTTFGPAEPTTVQWVVSGHETPVKSSTEAE